MTSIEISFQPEHGYVILVVVLLGFVNLWGGFKVGSARKLYGIDYPQMYAEKSDEHFFAFNCVQRAHQNMIENIAIFLGFLFTASIYRPVWAAIAGLIRVLGFVAYIHFYSSGDPSKRLYGAFGHLAFFVLVGLSVEVAFRLITA